MPESLPMPRQGLYPVAAPPAGPAWNHADFAGADKGVPLRQAAVLVGLRQLPQPRLILTVRTMTLQAHAGQVAFPGGRVDPDDADAVATALREAEEEIGLARHWVQPLACLERFQTVSGYLVTPVLAWVDPAATCIPQPAEVDQVFEVPLAFLRDPANLRHQRVCYRGRQHALVEYHYQGYRIWGATAAILHRWLSTAAAGDTAGFPLARDPHV